MIDSIQNILNDALAKKVSDILIVCGSPLSYKINGQVLPVSDERLSFDDTEKLVNQIYELSKNRDISNLDKIGDDDFSISISGFGRFRCNAYKQRNSLSAILRTVAFELPDPDSLGIPPRIFDLLNRNKGLILMTGPAGSGKSTTLACMIDHINRNRKGHIITLEDPIEYLHSHHSSIVSQREINHDTQGYDFALRAALRQSPDVILVGEMRDFDTIQTVITAAETGQLVLSTLHTIGAAKTIDRIVDVFPPSQQMQIRVQLSMALEAVISQRLVPTIDGKVVAAFEIMVATPAIRNMIREAKVHQMDNVLYAGASQGMQTLDMDLMRLFREKIITRDNAIMYSANPEIMSKKLI